MKFHALPIKLATFPICLAVSQRSTMIIKTHVVTFSLPTTLPYLHNLILPDLGTGQNDKRNTPTVTVLNFPSAISPITYLTGTNILQCWGESPGCVSTFNVLKTCYEISSVMDDPNNLGQSQNFQSCICSPNTFGFSTKPKLNSCLNCMRKVGLDKSLLDNVSQSFCDFCGASIPSEFLFLKFYIEFLKSAQMPREFVSHVGAMTDVTSLQDKFISSKGLNEVSAMPSGDTLQPFPSDLLDMIDRKWPYQTYAPARQPGQHTTLTLLECETCTKVAALYVASLQWYPRPLGTQKPLDYTFNPAPESASRNSSAQSPTPSTKRSSTTSEQPLSTTLVPSSSTRIPPAITEGPPPFQQTTSLSASCKRIGGAVVCPTTNESSTGAGD